MAKADKVEKIQASTSDGEIEPGEPCPGVFAINSPLEIRCIVTHVERFDPDQDTLEGPGMRNRAGAHRTPRRPWMGATRGHRERERPTTHWVQFEWLDAAQFELTHNPPALLLHSYDRRFKWTRHDEGRCLWMWVTVKAWRRDLGVYWISTIRKTKEFSVATYRELVRD